MSIKAENMNRAIVKKLERVLANTECIDSLCITIEGNVGEAPTIEYTIKEIIVSEGDRE